MFEQGVAAFGLEVTWPVVEEPCRAEVERKETKEGDERDSRQERFWELRNMYQCWTKVLCERIDTEKSEMM